MHAELLQVAAMKGLLDGHGPLRRLDKGLHRLDIRRLGAGDGENPRKTAEINSVLNNIGLEAVARQCAGSELGVERQLQDRGTQSRRAAPGFLGKKAYFCGRHCLGPRPTSISNSRSWCTDRSLPGGLARLGRI